MKTRLHIDRLVLRTQGFTPAGAEAAARALGPALADQLERHALSGVSRPALSVTLPASAAASPALIARHIADQLKRPAQP